MTRLNTVETAEQVRSLTRLMQEQEYIAYDTETTGLTNSDSIIGLSVCANENEAHYIIIKKWADGGWAPQAEGIDEAIKGLLEILATKKLIMHNSLFDCRMTENCYKINLMPALHTDTMILAHLLDENRRVGLKDLARQYFGEDSTAEQAEMKKSALDNGAKLTKKEYEMYKADAHIMAKYGAKDALLTYNLCVELVLELRKQNLYDFFYKEESMPLLKSATYDMNMTGLKVDQQAITQLKATLEAECAAAMEFILSEVNSKVKHKYPGTNKRNHFNIGSSQQLAWLIYGVYGLDFSKLTDEGKKVATHLGFQRQPYRIGDKRDFISKCQQSLDEVYHPEAIVNGKVVKAKKIKSVWTYTACDKTDLKRLAPRYDWIARLQEYQKKKKLLSTYVSGIMTRTQYGVIYPSFLQHGTTSGRYSSRDPNFQNLPREDKSIKKCIVARPGKVFVGADYSQLEPRLFAFYSNDDRLLKAFDGSTDFYSVIGMEVYGVYDCTPHKEGSKEAFGIKYPEYRHSTKQIALAVTYGASAYRLTSYTGKSVEATQEDIDRYFESFPKVKDMMNEAHKLIKTNGYVTNHFGRPRRLPEALNIEKFYPNAEHDQLPYEMRTILNLAVNHRIQSTAASIVNRSAIRFYEYLKQADIRCKIVMQVHDSLIAECDEADAEDVAILLQAAMETTVDLKTINLEAVPKIGNSLGEV